METTIDMSELAGMTAAFRAAPQALVKGVQGVVAKGALNVKTGMQQDFAGLRHAPAFPASITYDTVETSTGAEAEIGPDKNRRQGALGNILAFGTANNAPVADFTAALRREEPNLIKFLFQLGGDSLG